MIGAGKLDRKVTIQRLATSGTTGPEIVTYPNFVNSNLSQWLIPEITGTPVATKTWNSEEFMRITVVTPQGTGANLYATFGQTLDKTYRLSMRVRGQTSGGNNQGSTFYQIGDAVLTPSETIKNPALTTDWQDYEFVITTTTSIFKLYTAAATPGDKIDFDSISLKENGTHDAFGQSTLAWEDVATVPCRKKDMLSSSSQEVEVADQPQTKTVSEFTIRYRSGLTGTERLSFEGEIYELVRIAERGRKRYQMIIAFALDSTILD